MKASFLLRALILAISIAAFRPLFAPTPLKADVISTAQMQVGIGTNGNLFDSGAVIGMRRTDGYDPISPGAPREAWGISAGSSVGFADTKFGPLHLSTTARTFTSSSGQITTFLQSGATNLLQVVQKYSFVPGAGNILKILTTVTNVTASNQAVYYSRNVDWDINPTFFNNTVIPAYSSPILQASFSGEEAPSPLALFANVAPTTGGTMTGDLGAGMRINLGTLLPGQSTTFDVFHGISLGTQTRSNLASQLVTAGANVFVASGDSTDHVNSAAMGFGFEPAVVPLPSSVWMGGVLLGLIGIVRLVRRQAAAD